MDSVILFNGKVPSPDPRLIRYEYYRDPFTVQFGDRLSRSFEQLYIIWICDKVGIADDSSIAIEKGYGRAGAHDRLAVVSFGGGGGAGVVKARSESAVCPEGERILVAFRT
jgi:hypothetical protein